jgi:hypothetical protein
MTFPGRGDGLSKERNLIAAGSAEVHQSRSNLKMRAVNERTTDLVVVGTSALRQEWLEPNWNSEKSRAGSLGSKFIVL